MKQRRILFWAFFTVCAFFLLFSNLGDIVLWQDEAETALFGRNTLAYGVPKAFDGKNIIAQNQGRGIDKRLIFNYRPWLDIYLTAGSFFLFGESTFTARLPFALFGFLALLLVHRCSRRWSGSLAIADGTMWLTLLSVPYLLHARQCRYYVLTVFFAFYLFHAYEDFIEKKPRASIHLLLALTGLFHSSYLMLFAVGGGTLAHFLWCAPKDKRSLKRAAWIAALSAVLFVPWIVYFQVFARAAQEAGGWWDKVIENILFYAAMIDLHIAPLAAGLLFGIDRNRLSRLRRPLAYLLGGMLFLVLAPRHYFRYLLCFLPLLIFFLLEGLRLVHQRRPKLAGGLLLALLATNVLSPVSWFRPQRGLLKTDLWRYLYEITHEYTDPLEAAVDYLRIHGREEDILLITYPDLPFMFYTKVQVIGGGSGRRRVSLRNLRWLIVRSEREKTAFPVDYGRFEAIALDAPTFPWGNRPDPNRHQFRTPRTERPAVLYRRRPPGRRIAPP